MMRENLPLIVIAVVFCITMYVVYRDVAGVKARVGALEAAARAGAEAYQRQVQALHQAVAATPASGLGVTTADVDDDDDLQPPPPPPAQPVVRGAGKKVATQSAAAASPNKAD